MRVVRVQKWWIYLSKRRGSYFEFISMRNRITGCQSVLGVRRNPVLESHLFPDYINRASGSFIQAKPAAAASAKASVHELRRCSRSIRRSLVTCSLYAPCLTIQIVGGRMMSRKNRTLNEPRPIPDTECK